MSTKVLAGSRRLDMSIKTSAPSKVESFLTVGPSKSLRFFVSADTMGAMALKFNYKLMIKSS